jgi:hypothetical protein
MNALQAIGTGVSLVGLLITMMLGSMWMGELSSNVKDLKGSAVTDSRITRIETRLDAMVETNKELAASLNRLLTRLERNDRPIRPE